jgi:nitroimidazol reductase NimA-like FMN-containing flavoprotein (pyridoxamine 5'-phosphate oxidase superfamily)
MAAVDRRTEPNQDPEVLSTSECWRLLRTHSIGRFVANRPGTSPYIVPVNFSVDQGLLITIRTEGGTKVDLGDRAYVALEVDEIDPVHHVGWSVVVDGIGRAAVASEADLAQETWAPGSKRLVVRITPTQITGRRLRLHTPSTDARGYR